MIPIHPRVIVVRQASIEIAQAVTNAMQKHELTYAEAFSILGEQISGLAKFAIRQERHGDTDTPGGEATDEGKKDRL